MTFDLTTLMMVVNSFSTRYTHSPFLPQRVRHNLVATTTSDRPSKIVGTVDYGGGRSCSIVGSDSTHPAFGRGRTISLTPCVSVTRFDVELSLPLGEDLRFVAHRSSGLFEVDISLAENFPVAGVLELDNTSRSFQGWGIPCQTVADPNLAEGLTVLEEM